jgi:hypothetical protein
VKTSQERQIEGAGYVLFMSSIINAYPKLFPTSKKLSLSVQCLLLASFGISGTFPWYFSLFAVFSL